MVDWISARTSGVGEPPTERISVTKEARTGKGVEGTGQRWTSFLALGFSGELKLALSATGVST